MDEHLVDIDGLRFNIRVAGQGPALLLLHGFTGTLANMQGLADYFSRDHQVLSIDFPGHGGSSIPTDQQDYLMPRIAERLIKLLDHCGIAETCIIGYSMGGRLALYMAAHYPQRILAVATIGASAGLQSSPARAQRRQDDEALAQSIEQHGLEAFVDRWMKQPLLASQQSLGADFIMQARQQRLNNNPQGLALSLRGMGLGQQSPLQGMLALSAVPLLLLAGEKDPKFCCIAEEIVQQCTSAERAVVKSAGHAVHLEAKEESCRIIDNFFTRLNV